MGIRYYWIHAVKTLVDFEVYERTSKTGEVNLEKLRRIREQFPFLKSGDKFTIEL